MPLILTFLSLGKNKIIRQQAGRHYLHYIHYSEEKYTNSIYTFHKLPLRASKVKQSIHSPPFLPFRGVQRRRDVVVQ